MIDVTDDGPWPEPLLWHAETSASPGSWAALGVPAGRAGLLPVLIDVGDSQGGPEQWELLPGDVSYPGDHDAEDVLAEFWEDLAGEDEDGSERPWPGLAPAAPLTHDPGTGAARLADSLSEGHSGFRDLRLALVPARRSADIPAAFGWTGPLNHENDVARLCAVLRSWEDRFGIRVVALGFDVLAVSVAAPPATLAEAEALAAEHYAFCPDNVTQSGSGKLTDYARQLVGEQAWHFWWD
ncbi:hypothetical protein GCM10010121_088700 [Streptomyces brasiliensis]|uniref:DUF4253 domain-containing protein n=1 Tax=Streptomyces brasiliensis TaxID=1954 RepID=A0A917P6R6_9ACTN|nr:hypothetical protein GCM10010121_088700 [Streptomyces brasiliensis]